MNRRELVLLLTGALTAPRVLCAQHKTMPVIGYIGSSSAGLSTPYLAAFRQGLAQTGYLEGQNVVVEYRWAEGRFRTAARIGRRSRRPQGRRDLCKLSPTTPVATVAVAADGSCMVYCGTVDMGQGCTTAMALIAVEALWASRPAGSLLDHLMDMNNPSEPRMPRKRSVRNVCRGSTAGG